MMPTISRYRPLKGDLRGQKQGGSVARDARYADPEGTVARRVAWIWSYSTHSPVVRRDAQRGARLALPRTVSHRTKRLGVGALGRTRHRTRSEILQTDANRSKAARDGGSELGSARARDRQSAPGHVRK